MSFFTYYLCRRGALLHAPVIPRLCSYVGTVVLLSWAIDPLSCYAFDSCQSKVAKPDGGIAVRVLADIADNDVGKPPLQGEVDDAEVVPKKVAPNLPLTPLAVPVLPETPQTDAYQGKLDQTNQSDAYAGKAEQAREGNKRTSAMTGTVDKSLLKGNEAMDDQADNGLKPLTATAAPSGALLKGGARIEDSELAGEDPDAQDQELQVEWDRWRNRFLRAVLSGAMDNLNNPQEADLRFDPRTQRVTIQFPLGTIAWFSCQITNDRQIQKLRLDQSSGYQNYDRAVLNAVRDLQDTAILQFPRRSRRTVVSQNGGVKTSDHTEQQYFHFGDVERYRVPGN